MPNKLELSAINLLVDRLNNEEDKKEFITKVVPFKIHTQESL